MNSRVAPTEGKCAACHSNKAGEGIIGEMALVDETKKYLVRGLVLGHIEQWNDYSEEPQYVKNQNKALEPR